MLRAYLNWGGKITTGEIGNWQYNELIDFVNFRMETAHACLYLIEHDKIADALGLCRALLENYLLFMLMCRGHKYFRLQDKKGLTDGQLKNFIAERQAKLTEDKANDTNTYMAVKKYSRRPKTVMYVFEGLAAESDPDMVVPLHYFLYQEFRPEVMRLKHGDYFEHFDFDPDTQKILKGHQQEAADTYRLYLSYDSLLTCLEINDLADAAAITRIEAHYTFLGQFLHPTSTAARELHESSNYHEGKPAIGMSSPYKKSARLLAALYVCYLVAGILKEIALVHDDAPSKYIANPGTADLHLLINQVPKRFHYFWFLFNEPTLYDKFQHYNTHATEEQTKQWNSYSNTPPELIKFNQHILAQLEGALTTWTGGKAGHYSSPLP